MPSRNCRHCRRRSVPQRWRFGGWDWQPEITILPVYPLVESEQCNELIVIRLGPHSYHENAGLDDPLLVSVFVGQGPERPNRVPHLRCTMKRRSPWLRSLPHAARLHECSPQLPRTIARSAGPTTPSLSASPGDLARLIATEHPQGPAPNRFCPPMSDSVRGKRRLIRRNHLCVKSLAHVAVGAL